MQVVSAVLNHSSNMELLLNKVVVVSAPVHLVHLNHTAHQVKDHQVR